MRWNLMDISIKQIINKLLQNKVTKKRAYFFYHFGPKLKKSAGVEGSVSQGNVYIKFTFKGSHQTSNNNTL